MRMESSTDRESHDLTQELRALCTLLRRQREQNEALAEKARRICEVSRRERSLRHRAGNGEEATD